MSRIFPPAPDHPLRGDARREGVELPSVPRRHHIQMGQHAHGLFAVSEFDVARPVIHVTGAESCFPSQGKHVRKSILHGLPVRKILSGANRYRIRLYTRYRNQF